MPPNNFLLFSDAVSRLLSVSVTGFTDREARILIGWMEDEAERETVAGNPATARLLLALTEHVKCAPRRL